MALAICSVDKVINIPRETGMKQTPKSNTLTLNLGVTIWTLREEFRTPNTVPSLSLWT